MRLGPSHLLVVAFFAPLIACGSSNSKDSFGKDGGGDGSASNRDGSGFGDVQMLRRQDTGGSESGATGDGGPCTPNLTGRLRDFVNKPGFTPASALDDDFENEEGDDRGIVETDLGSDLKPVYAHGDAGTATTHGETQFNWWYRDTSGKNIPFPFTVPLTAGAGGVSTYDNQEFFPLDGEGWDDEYMGGETFTFIGDDDVFVFINNKLVVDLGGVHTAETKSIALDTLVTDDASQAPVPLTKGTTYGLDIFYNERHTVASHFRMETSIGFNNCMPIIAPQ
jgi:fibro-slime domain-containing protein